MTESAPIIEFSGDPAVIEPGGSATLRWRVEGVRAVYFYPEGERWQDHGVVGGGEQQVQPTQTTTYCLRVQMPDDSVEVHKIRILVQAHQDTATVRLFAADRLSIGAGESVTFRWNVEGVKAVYFFAEGQPWKEHGVVGVGEQKVSPAQTTAYRLRVLRRDDSVEVRSIAIQVRHREEIEAVEDFSVDRAAIRPGEPVMFHWRVRRAKGVYFHPEGVPWQGHAVEPVSGERLCLPQTETHCLRVVQADGSVEVRKLTVQVQPLPESDVVKLFAVDRDHIRAGECVNFRWRVEGVKAVYFHNEERSWQDRGVAGAGEAQRCPPKTTTYCLRVIKRDDSIEVHGITIQVQAA